MMLLPLRKWHIQNCLQINHLRPILKSFVILILIISSGCAGLQTITDSERTFDRVIEAPGYSNEQIYEGTKSWIAANLKSAKAAVGYYNKESGTIIEYGVINYPCNSLTCIGKEDWKVSFAMRVDVKDQRFRLTFSNLQLMWPSSYKSIFTAKASYEGPINSREDLNEVKPVLLKFGDELLASFAKNSNW